MHLHAVEEALDDNDAAAVLGGTMKVEEHERLSESGRKPILGFRVGAASSVRDENAVFIVDWDNDALPSSPYEERAQRQSAGRFRARSRALPNTGDSGQPQLRRT